MDCIYRRQHGSVSYTGTVTFPTIASIGKVRAGSGGFGALEGTKAG